MKNSTLLLYAVLLSSSSIIEAIAVVDVELQMLIDISGSVNSSEYELQMNGYKAAFESSNVQDAIVNGTNGRIAVQLIMWSGSSQQEIMIDWTLIDSPETSNAFAATIDTLARPFSGMTAIGDALNYGYTQFANNDIQGLSQVIDVSGDGTNNSGTSPESARDNALNAGIDKINGIVITSRQKVIDEYANSVVAGDNAFLLVSATFEDFKSAIETKVEYEIQGVAPPSNVLVAIPEPSSIVLFLTGISFFANKRYRNIKESK